MIFWRFPLSIFLFSCNLKIKNKILWIHDGEPLCKFFELFNKDSYVNNMIVNCYDKLDYIISPSKFLYNKIMRYNTKNNNISYVIPNFVKKNISIHNKKKKNKILWHVNFNRGLQIILKNWNKILELNKDFEIHIYGNKNELYLNNTMYDNIDIRNVYFHPKIEHKELINIIPEFKFFLYPGIIRESFSISTWECLINGCIPIVYDIGAVGEIINYGGTVVPPGNFEEIIECLRELLDDKNYNNKISEINSHDFKFISEDNIMNQWLLILEDLHITKDNNLEEKISDEYIDIFKELKKTYKDYSLEKYKYKII